MIGRDLDVLSHTERARAGRFLLRRDRRDYVAAHALLRTVLSRYDPRTRPADWTFVSSPTGKPLLGCAGAPLVFNLSHTHGLVACAVALPPLEIGVDVERRRDEGDLMSLAERFFAPEEAAVLRVAALEQQRIRFIETWTLKESIVKVSGDGLSAPLDAFAITSDGTSRLNFVPPPGEAASSWFLALFTVRAHQPLAVAARARTPPSEAVAYEHSADGRLTRLAAARSTGPR